MSLKSQTHGFKSSRRTCAQIFTSWKNPSTSTGFEPAKLGSRDEHVTLKLISNELNVGPFCALCSICKLVCCYLWLIGRPTVAITDFSLCCPILLWLFFLNDNRWERLTLSGTAIHAPGCNVPVIGLSEVAVETRVGRRDNHSAIVLLAEVWPRRLRCLEGSLQVHIMDQVCNRKQNSQISNWSWKQNSHLSNW